MTRSPARPCSLRAFAKLLRVSHTAVEKGVTTGRLVKSVGLDARGRPVIVDAKLAREEWKSNASKTPVPGVLRSLAEAQTAQHLERTRGLKLENDRKSGRLLDAKEVELSWSQQIVAARTQLLGFPTRAKQRLPHLTLDDLAVLDSLVREALEALADPTERGRAADGSPKEDS